MRIRLNRLSGEARLTSEKIILAPPPSEPDVPQEAMDNLSINEPEDEPEEDGDMGQVSFDFSDSFPGGNYIESYASV